MNCDEALERLSEELDGALTEQEHTELQAHLAGCASCRAVFEAMQSVDALLPETALEPPAALHDTVMREVRADAERRKQKKRWVPVAVLGAAAAAAFLMGAYGIIDMPGFSGRHRSTASLHEIVETMFPATQSEEYTSEAAAEYARSSSCAVLVIWECDSLPELTDSDEKLADGGRIYPVDAAMLESLIERYRGVYPMESYAPEGGVDSAAVILYK